MTGKSTQPGVRHKGWICVDIEDLGERSAACEMCEIREIRYAHYIEHPRYPLVLGCVCASHIVGNGAVDAAAQFAISANSRERWSDPVGDARRGIQC
jgi:hypothetical protein